MDALTMSPAPTSRISMRFSADGSRAACLAGGPDRPLQVEVWTLGAGADRPHRLHGEETAFTQVLPAGSRGALVVRHRDARHDLVRRDGVGERLLATESGPGFRLVPGPRRAFAVSWDLERSTVWSVQPGHLERLAVVPGRLDGGAALAGGQVGFTLDGTAVGLDPVAAAVRPLAGQGSHLVLADPASGLAVLAVRSPAGLRLAYRGADPAGDPERLTVPERLNELEGTVLPLAVSPGGTHVALRVNRGARGHLYLHRVADDVLEEVAVPLGMIGATAGWSPTGLRFPYSSPSLSVGLALAAPWRVTGVEPAPAGEVHLERFPGPVEGQVEAVVYGDWRTSRLVVVALHGGPDAAWYADHNPLFQALAAAGVAVVAPNQRGSTGYGDAHAAAVRGAWGGPDREDVDSLGLALRRGRPAGAAAPALYGESYGAYLALLAAAHRPGLWSRCAAVAPFLSGARLYDEATPAVRSHIDRLGGRDQLPDGAGDLLTVGGRIDVPLLVVHGSADEIVPVGQSRRLHRHLRACGRDVRYIEVPGAGHDPGLTEQLLGFLSSGDPSDQERR